MPRLVRLEATGPVKIDPAAIEPGKNVFVCACGLSRTFPMCDGSHKAAKLDEKPGVLSVYDRDRLRVVEERAE